MKYPTNYYGQDPIWEDMWIEAESQLFQSLGRFPTDEEVERRAKNLISLYEPDFDSILKDDLFDFDRN